MTVIGYKFADGSRGYVISTARAPTGAAETEQANDISQVQGASANTYPCTTEDAPASRARRLQRLLPARRMTEDDLQSSAPLSLDVLRAALPLRFAAIHADTEEDMDDADCFVFDTSFAA